MTANLPESKAQRDIKWADGLRGIAALFVVTSHLTLGFAPSLVNPAPAKDAPPRWYNLPIVRVFAEGPTWVDFFFLLTGFVNAMGPIKRARAGGVDAALAGLASSTFRRSSRLVLPCTIATVFAWAVCQLGGFKVGRMARSEWMRNTSPEQAGSLRAAVWQLLGELWRTWAKSDNIYDRNQWTMPFFLKASFMLFVALLATVKAVPRWRVLIMSGLFAYSWFTKDTMMGLAIYGGALLAELSLHPAITAFSTTRSLPARLLPTTLLLTGLVLCSFTREHPSWSRWTAALDSLGHALFPHDSLPSAYWPAIGCQLVTLAIILSAPLQRLLAHPVLLWLGQASFPIYLLHGPLLRSFLTWMVYAGMVPDEIPKPDAEDGEVYLRLADPPAWRFVVAIPVFWVVLLALAYWWTLKVEPWCALVTRKSEDVICGRTAPKAEAAPPPPLLPMSENGQRLVI